MKINKIIAVFIPILLNLFCTGAVKAQEYRCGCCYEVEKEKRKDIVGEKLKDAPYKGVASLYVNSKKFRGTAFFITNNVIMTAKHVLLEGKKPKKLYLHVNSSLGSIVVLLRKKDYQIHYKESVELEDDIALIKIKNPVKYEDLDIFNFTVENFENVKSFINDTIYVTGYPCDKGLAKPDVNITGDTLTDKYITPVDSTIFNSNRTIMGFYTCACAGDSGAPLWVTVGNNIYIIGVYRGLSNSIHSKRVSNIAVMLTQQKIDWINSVLRE